MTTKEAAYLSEVLASDLWIGDGPFSRRCEALIREQLRVPHAYLTPSCTSALEMACILAGLEPGDEVIMPSFGFSSAANAVVLRGAIPVFVDIRADTLNIDEALIEGAITERTRAIVVVHYAGVCCETQPIWAPVIAQNIVVIEDAAQAYLSSSRLWGREAMAGNIGNLATFSFHHTKNIRCGEGGALICGASGFSPRAEIIRDKGTDRAAFMRGEIPRYTWVDLGGSHTPSEFQAAVLLAQLENAEAITARRVALWNLYHTSLQHLEHRSFITRPTVPAHCRHNGHIYRVMLPTNAARDRVLAALRAEGIGASFHYVPLHSAPAGRRYGRLGSAMTVTDDAAARLLRLPLTHATTEAEVERVVERLGAVV